MTEPNKYCRYIDGHGIIWKVKWIGLVPYVKSREYGLGLWDRGRDLTRIF